MAKLGLILLITCLVVFLGATAFASPTLAQEPQPVNEIVTDYMGDIRVALLEVVPLPNGQQCSGFVLFTSPEVGTFLAWGSDPADLVQQETNIGQYPSDTKVDFTVYVGDPCTSATYALDDSAHVTIMRVETTWYVSIDLDENGIMDIGLAVQVVPAFHPVVFIHGLGGVPEDWTTSPRDIYINTLKGLGYDNEIIGVYAYADADGDPNTYDYQGNVKKISKGLPEMVSGLSSVHRRRGGDGKVDIVGFSLGGLIARYYANTHPNNHRIRNLITIGTPHRGLWPLKPEAWINTLAPEFATPLLRSITTEIYQQLLDGMFNQGNPQPLIADSEAFLQIVPDCQFLNDINDANKIATINYIPTAGIIDLELQFKMFHVPLIRKGVNVGDGYVLKDSALGIPSTHVYPFAVSDSAVTEVGLQKDAVFGYKYGIALDWVTVEDLLSYHQTLPVHPLIVSKVLQELKS